MRRQPLSYQSTPEHCKRCRAAIWRLLVNGIETQLDTIPATPADELTARLNKRWAYEIRRWSTSFEADFRSARRIANTRPNTIVLLAHHCGSANTSDKHPEYFPPRFTAPPAQKEPPF